MMIDRTRLAASLLCSQALLLCACPAVVAQTQERWSESVPQGEEEALQRVLFRAINERDWLKAAEIADRYRAAPDSVFAQYQAFLYAMVGRPDLIAAMEEGGLLVALRRPALCGEDGVQAGRDALETIAEEAARHRVVVLQERHWDAQHRVLLHELLPLLRERGFDYFAAEDFTGAPAAYEELAYPGRAPGFHSSREPVLADAVRRAIRLGYRLVPYEASFPPPSGVAPQDIQQWRVDQQAQNLRDRILAVDPEAKVLVFAGLGHAREQPDPAYPTFTPMAMRLKELTDLDPLTVDQAGCRVAGSRWESGAAIAFESHGAARVQGAPAGTFDLQVSYEAERYERTGRADWLARLNRKPVAVPERLRRAGEAVVVEARIAAEPPDATPFDRLYLGRDENLPLMLASGEYRITAGDGSDPIVIAVE